ncbi:uncharacterized protein METZ01_LOCUS229295 [marine metagenome]|uniref:Uncharacterized protein n=1 Tax=marine metagenome TaxID=408172 RepID=A0A382GQL1_9ZZZZ
MLMGCSLYVLIWDVLDNDDKEKKWKIDLGEKLHQMISESLDTNDKEEIKKYVQHIVITHLKGL